MTVRVKPAGEAAVDTADKAYFKEQKSGTAVMVRRMTASIVDIDKSASSISFEGPNRGNTADGSSIRKCSIRSR